MNQVLNVLRVLATLACLFALLTGVAGIASAAFGLQMFTAMFEFCIALAGMVGLLALRGRFGPAIAMSLVCVAGVLAVGGLLSYVGMGPEKSLFGRALPRPVQGLLLARVAAGAVLGLAAAAEVLRLNPARAMPKLLLGIALGSPLLVGLLAFRAGWLTPVAAKIAAMPGLVIAMTGFAAFVAVVGLLAASAHLIISAFQAALQSAPASAPEPRSA